MLQTILLLFSTFYCFTALAQTIPEPLFEGISEIYLAKDNGSGEAGEATDNFVTTDVPIYCVVLLATAQSSDVRMNLIAVNVAGVDAGTEVVSASFTTNGQHDRVNFTGRPEGIWIEGNYRVDILIDERLAGSKTLDIKKAANRQKSAAAVKPRNHPKSKSLSRIRKN